MADFLHTPLFWLFLGIFFMLIETTHFGFTFFFFGIGAFITAITAWAGLTNSLAIQMVVFILSSLFFLFLLRKKMSDVFKGKISGKLSKGDSIDSIEGERAVVVAPIHSDGLAGKVEFHGTIWEAQSDSEIEKDAIVEIVNRENLTLKVKPVKK